MSLATPSPALVASGPRNRGLAIVLFCLGGFALGQFIALFTSAIARAASGTTLSLQYLAAMAEPPWWFIVATLVGLWIGFLATTVFVQYRYRVIATERAFRFELRDLWVVPAAVGLQLAIAVVYSALHVQGTDKPSRHLLGSASGGQLIILAGLTIVVVPAIEELFFRGTLLPGLRDLVGSASVPATAVLAVGLDGILFGLAHGEWVQLPALAVVGMVLAWLYWHYGRLWPNYLMHASFNAIGVVVALNVHSTH